MRKYFEDAGQHLVFYNPQAASGTRGGTYSLEIRENFSGRFKALARKRDVGYTIFGDGQVAYNRLEFGAANYFDIAYVGVHESGHKFLRNFLLSQGFLNIHSKGDDIMNQDFKSGHRPGFSPEQAQALSEKCK